jgi:DNA segregation ATPase FtsK/SpoIIIE, S-DNA-T family
VLTIATGPRRRLWERRRGDPDYLLLRVGTAYVPSAVVVEDPAGDEGRREVAFLIPDAPVTVPLAEMGVLGVAGPAGIPRAVARWLAGQAVTLHSPCDLRLCVLTDGLAEHEWDWLRWLPHARPAEGQHAHVLIGNDAETVAAPVAELTALVAGRQQASRGAIGEVRFAQADKLVVLDGARRLCSSRGWSRCCARARRSASGRCASTPGSGCSRPSAGRSWPPARTACGSSRRALPL